MNALSPEQRVRHRELEQLLLAALAATRELADGYEFQFALAPATYTALTDITPLEHACCPFFTIVIRVEQDKVFWQLTGSKGVKEFIRLEFAEWMK
ncbi:MAG TPA: hypothetical protein VFR84_04270 [Candidatus Angelobacter sp.]|nr:hypothetical protein [Candidatus Angelobacter sp.]